MRTPKMTVTMLGAPGSGKTMFLHGMYAILSGGLEGYFLYTVDPDQDLDLMDAWELLSDKGETPPPTGTEPVPYEFVLKDGLNPLVEIDLVDFRGGAASSRMEAAPAEVRALRDRLERSDSIYLVLDGEDVGRTVAGILAAKDDGPAVLDRGRDPTQSARLIRYISDAAAARRRAENAAPSVVVLVTKTDLLAGSSGVNREEALRVVAENLDRIAPIATVAGVTAMLCPVSIGAFGAAYQERVDPLAMNPENVYQPMVFSLWHFLSESQDANAMALRQDDERLSDAAKVVNEHRSRIFGGLRHGRLIGEKEEEVTELRNRILEMRERMSEEERRAMSLMSALAGMPIIKDGKWQS